MVRTIGTENEALMKYLGWVDFEFLQKSITHTLYSLDPWERPPKVAYSGLRGLSRGLSLEHH